MLLIQYWRYIMLSDSTNDVPTALPESENGSNSNPQTNIASKSKKTEKKKKAKQPIKQEERIFSLTADNGNKVLVDFDKSIADLEKEMPMVVENVKSESTEVFYDFDKIKAEHETNQKLLDTNNISENIKNLINEQNKVYDTIEKSNALSGQNNFIEYSSNLIILVNAFEEQLKKLMGVETVEVNIKKQLNSQKIQCTVQDGKHPDSLAEYFFKIGKKCKEELANATKYTERKDFIEKVKKFKELQEKINEEKEK